MNNVNGAAERVEVLWQRLRTMEEQSRFGGLPYPQGMAPFPGKLTGQGFFPGGDGLWRDDGELASAARSATPHRGIMFLGNDFGTLETFRTTLRKGYENVPTWTRLKERLRRAGIEGRVGFYTNAVLGLRTEKTALEAMDWEELGGFAAFCREFLEFQLQTMEPLLVVVLGPKAMTAVCAELPEPIIAALVNWRGRELREITASERILRGVRHGLTLTFLLTTHPYSDLNKTEAQKVAEAQLLRHAWESAQCS